MKSSLRKRSVAISGRKTSVSLEDEFWTSLRDIAERRDESVRQLVGNINEDRQFANLSSAIRLFVLRFYRDQLDQRSETVVAKSAETRYLDKPNHR
jgi:predicted DNA-binding ribbon-helix-helix protein